MSLFLTSPNLDGIKHGFFTRKGGVSGGIYASLNCGFGSGDNPEHVRENRARVVQSLGAKDLVSLYQVHGDSVVTVKAPWANQDKPQADAMVTDVPGIALGILTADCVPVLFADKKQRVIGAAHAGWKGAFRGIIDRTVEAMCALGAGADNIHAAIGPCIGPKSYEVSQEFYQRFVDESIDLKRFFKPTEKPDHFLFDIGSYVQLRLGQAGVTHVNPLENDTYIEEDAFFSFRRTTHRKEPDYGRQVSAIMLK